MGRSSVAPGGTPGASDAAPPFGGDATADDDDDGLAALLERAFGGDDGDPSAAPYPEVSLVASDVGGVIGDYLLIRVQRDLAVDDVVISAELSTDLARWESGPDAVLLVDETANGDGTSTLTYRSAQPVSAGSQAYIRARAELSP